MLGHTRPLLRVVSIAVAALLSATLAGCGGGDRPRNLLLISVDTLRPDHLKCYGYGLDTSPVMDRLAAEGVLFEDVSSVSPWTLPSHATMLTGLLPSRHGVKDHVNKLTDDRATLASVLGEEGFQTFAVVNSHNVSERYGLARGFQEFHYVKEQGDDYIYKKSLVKGIANKGNEIVDHAIGQLEGRDDRPFFMFLHFYDVHTDFTPDPQYAEQFVRPYQGEVNGRTLQLVNWRKEGRVLTDSDIAYLFELYDAEIRTYNDVLDRLMSFLDESGLSEDTVVLLTSDHGEEFQEHGSYLHGRTHYQESIAIPWLMRGPGLPKGVRIREPVSLVDVAPTLLGLVDAPIPADLDGLDIAPLWQRIGESHPSRFLYGEADHSNAIFDVKRMVRLENYKLVFDRNTEEASLFNLDVDPGELQDVSETEARRRAILQERLEAFLAIQESGAVIEEPSDEMQKQLEELGYAR